MGLTAAAAVAAAPSPPGFIVWGLFASFAALVAGYAVWMFWVERREAERSGEDVESRP